MKYFLPFLALVMGFFLISAPSSAFEPDLKAEVEIVSPYAFATSEMQKNGAVFFKLINTGRVDSRLIGVTGDVAENLELHTHTMEDDIMQMREVDGYDLPAGESLMFEPMGHHIMLMGLKAPLVEGEGFPLTLSFENADSQTITIDIVAPGTKPEMHDERHHKHGEHWHHDHSKHGHDHDSHHDHHH